MSRILVVAAHPDDDVIGCGGLMSYTARCGGAVRALYLTDGSRSHPGSRAYDAAAVAVLREAEAREALRLLGIAEAPSFLRLPDGELAGVAPEECARTIASIASTIDAFGPDLVVAPWRRDPHGDHIAASELTRSAVALASSATAFATYEVWLRMRGSAGDRPRPGEVTTLVFELDALAVEAKRRSILAHASQTTNLISDDPTAFRITSEMIDRWVRPIERFHFERFGANP